MDSYERQKARIAVEASERWRDWLDKIPIIPMRPSWKVQPLPAYAGALARFAVINSRGEWKSVYLDAWERLGIYDGQPYWEVYPVDGDVGRCDLADVAELVRLIDEPRGDREPQVDRKTGKPVENPPADPHDPKGADRG